MMPNPPPCVLFWKPEEKIFGVFSQWADTAFVLNDLRFPSAEHYMMYQKALSQGDTVSATQVLVASDPREVFRIGKAIRPANGLPFDCVKWDAMAYDVVLAANRAKFAHNQTAREILLGTGDRTIVEASPHDRIWGIGYSAKAAADIPEHQWGSNLLGKALMQVRSELASDSATSQKAPVSNSKRRLVSNAPRELSRTK